MTAKHHFFSPARATGLRPAAVPQTAERDDTATASRPWWQPGVYCSAPALFLWIVARLPDDLLVQVFRGGASMPVVLNQLGDALFFCGWVISAILLWGQRRRS